MFLMSSEQSRSAGIRTFLHVRHSVNQPGFGTLAKNLFGFLARYFPAQTVGEARNLIRTFQLCREPPSHLPGQSDLLQVFEVDDTCTFCMDIPDLSGGDSEKKKLRKSPKRFYNNSG